MVKICAYLLCIASLLLMNSMALASAPVIHIEGLSGELTQNVKARLSTLGKDDISNGRLKKLLDNSIRQSLRALGYYDPIISFTPTLTDERPVSSVSISITAGQPIRVADVDIKVMGDASNDKAYSAIVAKAKKNIGQILNHGDYEKIKEEFNALAWEKGYFDAEWEKNELAVSRSQHQAFWTLYFNSGKRYRFGKVSYHYLEIDQQYLKNLLPFKEGDYYSTAQLGELNRRLSETGWFNNVLVTPEFNQSHNDNKLLPISVTTTPRAKNLMEVGAGYSTDIGVRLKSTWTKPWVNKRGHSFGTTLNLSKPEKYLDLSYKIPLKKNPIEDYYLVQAGIKREVLNDTRANSTTLNLARYWNLSSGWQRALNLRWSYDSFKQANVRNNTTLLYPGFSVNRTRQRGGMIPNWGDTQRYSIDFSTEYLLSDVNFAIFQAQNVWIRSLAERNRFIARSNLGWIETGNFSKIPPSLRFFAGGDRSIRGYKYKSISPKDDQGKLLGASKLITGSLEYQFNVRDKWWLAAFLDGGEAINSLHHNDFKFGTGIGIRWVSPLGPIKLDIARPVGNKENHNMQFYIGIGPEL